MNCDHHPDGPVGVVLFQLGGPDSLENVEPFLRNLFSDPDIIDFPFARLARPTLARLLASKRAQKVRGHYASIGGKSPLGELTGQQAAALERELRQAIDARVVVAMRYWHPMTEEAVREVRSHPFRHLVLLPLYPQYSKTTSGSSLKEWDRLYRAGGGVPAPTRVIREFFNDPLYLDALVERINQGLARFAGLDPSPAGAHAWPEAALSGAHGPSPESRGRERLEPGLLGPELDSAFHPSPDVHLVFSAHGVPESVIQAGDPYQAQVEATAELVMRRGRWANPHHICYQSRVGPGRWLEPSLRQTLATLAAQGAEQVLVIPVAFVSDHVETLSELNIEARSLAYGLGIRQFEVMPALNDSPRFIRALANLVLQSLAAGG